MVKKILFGICLMMLLVGTASAFEFDNVKKIDEVTKEITVKNSLLGIDWLSFGEVGRIKLINYTGYCFAGDCYAYYQVNNNAEVFTLKGSKYYNPDQTQELEGKERQYEIFNPNKERVVPIYKNVCTPAKVIIGNKTQDCAILNTENVTRYGDWEIYDVQERLPVGEYLFREKVDVRVGETVDLVPNFYGLYLTEWADFTGLTRYEFLSATRNNAMELAKTSDGWMFQSFMVGITGGNTTHSVRGISIMGADAIAPNNYEFNYTIHPAPKNLTSCYLNTTIAYGSTVLSLTTTHAWYNISGEINGTLLQGETYCIWYGSNATQRSNMFHMGVNTTSAYAGGYVISAYIGSGNDYDLMFEVWGSVATPDNTPTVDVNSPENHYNSTSSTITFNWTAQDDNNITNTSIYINDVLNQTIEHGTSNYTNEQVTIAFSEGSYNYTIDAYDDSTQRGANETRFFTVDTTAPTVSGTTNLTNLTAFSFPISSNWNYTATDTSLETCYYSSSDNSTNTTVTCNTTIQTNWTVPGIKTILYCANDSFGRETCNAVGITIIGISTTQTDSADPVGEETNVTYTLWVNLTGATMPTTTAYLYFNNTVYYPSSTNGSDWYRFVYGLRIPKGYGNTTGNVLDWYWNYTVDGFTENISTSTTNTTVYAMAIDNCSVHGNIILELNLKDEELNDYINLSALATNIEIDLILSKGGSEWNYSRQWTSENNVTICVPYELLNLTNYTIDFTIGFDADDHVNEFFYLDNGTLSELDSLNSLTDREINLMDLLTADSTSFLFNYFDEDGLSVDDVIVHVFRKYIGEGVFREVERAKQNDDGDTVVHLVEEDVVYYFVVSQFSEVLFTSNTYTALCQTTPCEIQLEESGGFQDFNEDWDLIKNGGYTLTFSSLTREVNLTYALNSTSKMNLTVYALGNEGEYSSVGSSEATGTEGSFVIDVPTVSGNTTFFATLYQDDEFVKSSWIDFQEDAGLYFGNVLSLFLGALIILALGLMAVSEGSATIVFVLLGMFIVMILGLVDYRTSTGGNILIYLIVAGGLLLWKVTRRNR